MYLGGFSLSYFGNSEFNQVTIILTLPLMCEPRYPFNKRCLTCGIFKIYQWEVEWR